VDAVDVPVTVKMRLGWDDASKNAPELAARAEALGVAAVTVHGRTRSQFYKGVADWTAVSAVRREVSIPVIVNGDIVDAATAREALARSGADAVMIGRGAYGRPWLAARIEAELEGRAFQEPGAEERLGLVIDHFRASLAFYGEGLGLKMFRKHLGAYIEAAPWPADPAERRTAKAALCRLETPSAVEAALTALWRPYFSRIAA
jgi:nifR3 family TIM-barrel protein